MNEKTLKTIIIFLFIATYSWIIWLVDFNHLAFVIMPWKDLGTPPERPIEVVNITRIPAPYTPAKYAPIVYVETESGTAYRCCSRDNSILWEESGHGYDYYREILENDSCTRELRDIWDVEERSVVALSYESRGWCPRYGTHSLAVFQVRDKHIFGKYMLADSKIGGLENIQKALRISYLAILIWLTIVIHRKKTLATLLSRWNNWALQKKVGIYSSIAMGIIVGLLATQVYITKLFNDFVGDYTLVTGFWSYHISITSDHSYSMEIDPDFDKPFIFQGKLIVERGNLRLVTSRANIFGQYPFIPIKWGDRRYLVETGRIEDFCIATVMPLGHDEPRKSGIGLFYLRDGDWSKPAVGYPTNFFGQRICPKED